MTNEINIFIILLILCSFLVGFILGYIWSEKNQAKQKQVYNEDLYADDKKQFQKK